jgi:transcriptional regulator with XRE-family HTH domain
MTISFPPILDRLNERLKQARVKLGLLQADLAIAGGVTRTAEVRYEAGETAPSIDYLRGIQSTGIDVPFILYGISAPEIAALLQPPAQSTALNWQRIKQAFNDVDAFLKLAAPNCPDQQKWELVQRVYEESVLSDHGGVSTPTTFQVLNDVLSHP